MCGDFILKEKRDGWQYGGSVEFKALGLSFLTYTGELCSIKLNYQNQDTYSLLADLGWGGSILFLLTDPPASRWEVR